MKVCIIGGGPSGLFLAKYLSPHVNSVTIFEKNEDFGGMYKYSINPKFDIFRKILNLENVKFIPNYEVKTDNFDKIEKHFDKFVIATGGTPNFDPQSNFLNVMDIITNKIPIETLGQKICIIGMGNVAFDACRKIYGKVKEIDICSRSSLYLTKFGNLELRELKECFNVKGFNVASPASEKEKRRHNLLCKTQSNNVCDKPLINLRFNSTVKNIKKENGKYLIEYTSGAKKQFDSVITSYGFNPNPIKLETNKPLYKLGWCKKAWGNINDALHEAQKLARLIIK